MNRIVSGTLTIVFDAPFYKGIFETRFGENYQVAQIVFGTSDPSLQQILQFTNHHWHNLNFFQTNYADPIIMKHKISPKRLQRLANRSIYRTGIGTKAQQALQNQREAKKETKNKKQKAFRDQHKRIIYKLKQRKRHEKHRGH
ncbi:MAG: YjdF family protein [Lentilactobacillus diolivorans]|jgi:hypothetical protein|nr:YjdF family protein [Lentilactobacillus diolivorans]